MTIKRLDSLLDAALWIAAILLVVGSWFMAEKLTAPEYEPVPSDFAISYTFETSDGDRVESAYGLAWYHKSFSAPVPVAYDQQYGRMATFKDEYVEKYRAMMSPSEYPGFWYRMFWVWFILLSVACVAIVIILGPMLRDWILCTQIKKNPKFTDCTYFLFSSRSDSTTKAIRKLVPGCAVKYLRDNKRTLEKRFNERFYKLIMDWMNVIVHTASTSIPFEYRFENKLKSHEEYIRGLLSYWNSRRGIDPKADDYIEELNARLNNNKYVPIPKIKDSDTYERSVVKQINKLFTEVMGTEIFSFHTDSIEDILHARFKGIKPENRIYVTITLQNSLNTFTWSGQAWSGYYFPGIEIAFTISHYVDVKERILWSKTLTPKCTYRAKESDFSETALYTRMVVETVDSFTETLKES